VTLELWGPGGTIDSSQTVSLPAGSRSALYLSDYWPSLAPHLVANIRVHSDKPIHGFALVNDRPFNFITPVPPIPIPAP
jgi:hypothetical protein